jgi:predicted metal-dependent HD superfamily phosphohydrolase
VLGVVDDHAGLAPHPERVRLAAWMHDAVYDPRALGDANERDSAEFAAGLLATLGVPDEVAAEVARLVGLTAGHATEPDDPDGELLCDADLAILASGDEVYAAYTAAIRREYAHVPDDAFRGGRTQVLKALLELPSIYRLAPLRAAWEERARANLARELAELNG